MRKAQTELERALGNLDAMKTHIEAMEHTVEGFTKQLEASKHHLSIMHLDLAEVQTEIRAAVKRLQELRAASGDLGEPT